MVRVAWRGESLGESTPPEVQSLIQSAPARSTSRTRRRIGSTPSTTVSGTSGSLTPMSAPQAKCWSVWPPVWLSAVTASTVRGPGMIPRSIARRTPLGAPPASRTVVKPASSVLRAAGTVCRTQRLGGVASHSPRSRPVPLERRWTWQSIRPGSSVRPSASTFSAPAGTRIPSRAPAALTRPSSTTTTAWRAVSPVSGSRSASPKTAVALMRL